jgi:hypothetical protein
VRQQSSGGVRSGLNDRVGIAITRAPRWLPLTWGIVAIAVAIGSLAVWHPEHRTFLWVRSVLFPISLLCGVSALWRAFFSHVTAELVASWLWKNGRGNYDAKS